MLIVESDDDERNALAAALSGSSLSVFESTSVADALERFAALGPSLVLSEIQLSDGSGFALCRQLRDRSAHQPVPILLTSRWSTEADRILAFECGADDFVAKPYYPREIASRVRAIMRRRETLVHPSEPRPRAAAETLIIDDERHAVAVGDEPAELTLQEFALLSVLANHRGLAFSRQELIARAWRNGEKPGTRSVDAHVKSLRRKLGDFGRAIETVRGVGYRFAESARVRVKEPPSPAHRDLREAVGGR